MAGPSKEQERTMEKVWFVDKMEVCKTCKLRIDTRDMGLECDVCKVWAPGLWSRSRSQESESVESHVFSWSRSRESESVFKTAGVGVGSRSRFFKTAGVGVGSRSRFFKTAGVGVGSRSRNICCNYRLQCLLTMFIK